MRINCLYLYGQPKDGFAGRTKSESRMNIYVGNLSRDTAEADLRQAFEAHGQVSTVSIIKDKYSGESKGFGFVEMPAKAEAEAAITNLNGKDLNGRTLNISEARPRTENRSGDRSGGGGGRDRRDFRGGSSSGGGGSRNRW